MIRLDMRFGDLACDADFVHLDPFKCMGVPEAVGRT